ncbi:MAG: nicotinate (nicotinamide) nucleotide adenylyltransferase [Clostridia bacterium]|nr:nicotinate (nicotinamide) nucleotide adenylyltransferase [Clostridia bacterium]
MRIGIFGGTFNPVHLEHINIAKNAKSELKLDKLLIVPTFLPPHKSQAPLDFRDRINMLKLAFDFDEDIVVSDFEIENQGKSYSYITAEHFRSIYREDEIFMIVGGDMLLDFKNWKYPERILSAVNLAVFNRENIEIDFAKEREYFISHFQKDFTVLNYCGKDFSSTEIRVYASLGLNVNHLTDKKVAEYIKNNNIYSGGEKENYLKKVLTEKRLIHTANVVITGLSKASELNLDKEKVYTACLLHDCAKYTNYKNVKGFVLDSDIPEPVIHSFLGAYIAKNVLGVSDEEVLDAIKYHTSGKANMSELGKLVFVADMVEKGRVYNGVEKLRDIFYKNVNNSFKECLKEEVEHLKSKGITIYKETLNAYEYYIK